MKKTYIYGLLLILLIVSCEDVIEVETPSEPPRLVLNALIRVDIEEDIIPIEVRATETSNFFDEIPVAQLDIINILQQVVDEEGLPLFNVQTFLTELEPGSGIYVGGIPVSLTEFDVLYSMTITQGEDKYIAQTRYVPSVPIDNLEIGDGTLFDEESTELIVTFTDDPDRNNYYVFDFGFGEFLALDDQFIQGQQFTFSYFYDQEFEPGTVLEVGILGADQSFFNYMDLLVEQTEGQQGPFQTPVATVRGNIFDISDLDNINVLDNVGQPDVFPLGYFAIVQEYRSSVTVP